MTIDLFPGDRPTTRLELFQPIPPGVARLEILVVPNGETRSRRHDVPQEYLLRQLKLQRDNVKMWEQ